MIVAALGFLKAKKILGKNIIHENFLEKKDKKIRNMLL